MPRKEAEMNDCKSCRNLYDSGKEYHCAALRTHCAKVKQPDLGRKLPGCRYEPIRKAKKQEEEENELQA